MAGVRRYSAAIPLLLALWVSGCAHVKPTPESVEVDSLKIEGTQKLTAAEVKEKILTTESPFWHRWFAVLPPVGWFDATAWQADLRRMTRYYEAHGYYQARILEEAVTPTPEGHVSILVKLSEGEPARITTVSIEGLEEVDAAVRESAVKAIGLKEGDIFLEDAWARAKSTLGAQLYEAGYAEVVVRGEAVVDADNATVTVKLICKPGLRYRFGSADDPKGLTLRHIFAAPEPGAQVPAAAIRDEVSPDIRAGEYFSDSAMKAAQARLFQMGVFAAVKVTRGAPEPETRTIPVVIDVREGPFHSARIAGHRRVSSATP